MSSRQAVRRSRSKGQAQQSKASESEATGECQNCRTRLVMWHWGRIRSGNRAGQQARLDSGAWRTFRGSDGVRARKQGGLTICSNSGTNKRELIFVTCSEGNGGYDRNKGQRDKEPNKRGTIAKWVSLWGGRFESSHCNKWNSRVDKPEAIWTFMID